MPYSALERATADDNAMQTFQNMLYLCIDCFNDRMEDEQIVPKTEDELAKDYRNQIYSLYKAIGPLLDNEIINDYWLVVTPRICDTKCAEWTPPLPYGNFIVTPFNYEDIELVEKIVVPSGVAGGTVRVNPDKNKRLATNSVLDVYVAVELNDGHPDFVNSESSLSQSLWTGDYVASYLDTSLRTFLNYGKREINGLTKPVIVEQYFDKNIRDKTNGYCLGEGFVRGKLRKLDASRLNKYIAFSDFFSSKGVAFCQYGLSLEELKVNKKAFSDSPWVKIDYPDD
jgi:hypothetical protein